MKNSICILIEYLDKWLKKEKNNRKQFYIIYTFLFFVSVVSLYGLLIINGKTNIWYYDGLQQHFYAYVYNGKYWRNVLWELFINHRLVLKEWEYALGEGADVLSSLHFYVIGDPFTLPTVIIPTRFMWCYYVFATLLRMYLAGISFAYMVFSINKNFGKFSVLLGSLTYAFCYWNLFSSVRHPSFINPLIYMPLVILGIENIIKLKKPKTFMVAVFLLAISNFYFFYVQVLITVVYVMIRTISLYKKDVKRILNTVMVIAFYSIISTCAAMVIVLPILFTYLSDNRMEQTRVLYFIYDYLYYKKMPGALMGATASEKWSFISVMPPVFIGMISLFAQRKKGLFLKKLFGVSFLFLMIPVFGQAFNVFSYEVNRWSFIIMLLSSYTLVYMWDEIWNVKEKVLNRIVIIICVIVGLSFVFDLSRSISFYMEVILTILCLYIMAYKKFNLKESLRIRQILIVLILFITMVYRGIYLFGCYYRDYASECKDIKEIKSILNDNEITAIEKAIAGKVNTDERYSGLELNRNLGLVKGVSGSTFYWSVSNPYISKFRNDLDMEETLVYCYYGYDDKTSLLSLNGVKYYVKPEENKLSLPYGFTYVNTVEIGDDTGNGLTKKYSIYENNNNLPLAYAYDNVLDKSEWEKLDTLKKQEIMLETCVVDEYKGNLKRINNSHVESYDEKSIIINENNLPEGMYVKNNKIIVSKKNVSLKISLGGQEKCETYLYVDGFKYNSMYEYDLYNSDDKDIKEVFVNEKWNELDNSEKDRIREQKNRADLSTVSDVYIKHDTRCDKKISLFTKDYAYYNGRDKYLINLGYSDYPLKEVTITFPEIGVYEYEDIKVMYLPMDNFENSIKKLKNNSMKNVNMGVDTITGTIDAKKNEMLCVNIPYSVGWKAYVDGVETKTYVANGKNIGIELSKGKHEIKLVYHTPFLRLGALISVVSVVLCLGLFVLKKFFIKTNEFKLQKS